MLGLTATERWSAARRLDTAPLSEEWFVVGASAVLVVLVALLVWISYRRWRQNHGQTRELFAENALRRGLGARDRQILLAIVMRSGLGRTQDVFTAVDAFDRGALKLLAECGRTRTAQENDQLRTEIVYLREKLGFQIASPVSGAAGLGRPSSREIPVGKWIELAGRDQKESVRIGGEVIRNDEIELALQLAELTESRSGDVWRARYCSGMSAWEFNTSTVNCDGHRLILNHSEEIRFINRRRFPRVSVRGHVWIAPLPFIKGGTPAIETISEPAAPFGRANPPAFEEGILTELAGPGLRIETSLPAQPGNRVLVVFTLNQDGGDAMPGVWRTIAGIGLVRHCRSMAEKASVAVELIGLNDAEIDELAYITGRLCSRIDDRNEKSGNRARKGSSHAVAAS